MRAFKKVFSEICQWDPKKNLFLNVVMDKKHLSGPKVFFPIFKLLLDLYVYINVDPTQKSMSIFAL